MSDVGAAVEIMGKTYRIKCPPAEIPSLKQAAQYLEEKMRLMRDAGVFSLDRIAIITALNIVHQLLTAEQQKNQHFHAMNQRLCHLSEKIDQALANHDPLELEPAES